MGKQNNIPWVALFSQTGSEIAKLANHFDRWPDYIITNRVSLDNVHPDVKHMITHRVDKSQARSLSILDDIFNREVDNYLITLHGWLRIVPDNICNVYDIYNGHPGLITRYEELKGKDPQDKIIASLSDYEYYGSVVHKVTAEVDGGEVVSCSEHKNNLTIDNFDVKIRSASFDAWVKFLNNKLI